MILSFSRKFPWGDKTEFVRKIQQGIKQHTFRIGHRWKVGDKIHFWDQNPRSTMINPKPSRFNIPIGMAEKWIDQNGLVCDGDKISVVKKFIPEQSLAVPIVSHIENWKIEVNRYNRLDYTFRLTIGDQSILYSFTPQLNLICHGTTLNYFTLEEVSNRDGFDSREDFIRWFAWDILTKKNINSLSMEGQVIHWTNNTYTK